MCPGLSDDLQQVDDFRKTTIINCKLKRLSIDITALHETRLPSNGSLREQDYMFFWQGKEPDEPWLHGMVFAVRNSLLSAVEPPSSGTACILSLCLSTSSVLLNFLSIYAPTLSSPAENKDEFYEELESSIKEIPATEHLYLLGDFNAQVGANHASWPSCISHFGVSKLNENWQRLLEVCSYYDLSITKTFFGTKLSHRVSWQHHRSHRWHQLDLLITQTPLLNCILITHSYHSADCDTNHSLVGSKVCLQPKQIHQSKQKGCPCTNAARTSMPDLCEHFADSTKAALNDCHTGNAGERWNHIPITIYNSTMDTFCKREAECKLVWTRDCWTRASNYGQESSTGWVKEGPLREVMHCTQESQKWCPVDCSMLHQWLLAEPLPEYSTLHCLWQHSCHIYGMKKAFGPSTTKIAPPKSITGDIITDQGKQIERWKNTTGNSTWRRTFHPQYRNWARPLTP